MNIRLKTSDLMYLADASKALKQQSIIFINNDCNTVLMGTDNIDSIITYVKLDPAKISFPFVILEFLYTTKELSSFVKNITIEDEFVYDISSDSCTLRTMSGVPLTLYNISNKYQTSLFYDYSIPNSNYIRTAKNRLELSFSFDNMIRQNPEVYNVNITNDISELLQMKKSDGGIMKFINGKYITLFPGILPINKSDKVIMSATTLDHLSFICKFEVIKKSFTVLTYIRYVNAV